MIADSSNFFFECDRSNSKAKIPHATVGRAAPATNRRRENCTASLTCVTWASSLVLTAAAINTTHKITPIAFRNIKALINRCPTGKPPFLICYGLTGSCVGLLRGGRGFIDHHHPLERCPLRGSRDGPAGTVMQGGRRMFAPFKKRPRGSGPVLRFLLVA